MYTLPAETSIEMYSALRPLPLRQQLDKRQRIREAQDDQPDIHRQFRARIEPVFACEGEQGIVRAVEEDAGDQAAAAVEDEHQHEA